MCITVEIFNNISNAIYTLVQDDLFQNNIEEYLDYRESPDFDKNWVASDKIIECHKLQNINDFIASESKLREKIFKKVIDLTSDYDLAGYVSDDAGLIYANIFFKCNDFFANKIYDSYKSNKLP